MTDAPTRLLGAWQEHVSDDTALLDRLVARHRERQRRYHRVEHVDAVVGHVLELAVPEPVDDLGAVVAAALYHDAIYEPTHPANERASARLARRDLAALGWAPERAEHVGMMIEATREHRDPPDAETAVLFDADLAILGAEPDDYAAYAAQVRAEYVHLTDDEWRAGRTAVLAALLAHDAIFSTPTGRRTWEAAARANITAELATLPR